jgi:hypothetical protein
MTANYKPLETIQKTWLPNEPITYLQSVEKHYRKLWQRRKQMLDQIERLKEENNKLREKLYSAQCLNCGKKVVPPQFYTCLSCKKLARGCLKKVVFKYKWLAEITMPILKLAGILRKQAYVYKCSYCPYWHRTSGHPPRCSSQDK